MVMKYLGVGYLKGESPLEGVWHRGHTPFEVKAYAIIERSNNIPAPSSDRPPCPSPSPSLQGHLLLDDVHHAKK